MKLLKDTGKTFAKFFLGLTLFVLFLFFIGPSNIYGAFASINPIYVPLIFFLLVLSTLFVPFPLLTLYYPIRIAALPWRDLYHLRLATFIAGSFTPSRVGELSLFFLIKRKYKIDLMPIFYVFVLDKLVTIFHTLLFSVVAFFILFKHLTTALYLLFALIFLILLFLGAHHFMSKIRRFFSRLLPFKKLRSFLTLGGNFSKTYLRSYSAFILFNFFLTFIFQLLISTIAKVTYGAFSLHVPFWTLFLVNTLLSLTSFLPFNFFGFGAKEATSIYLYSLVGVPAALTMSSIILFFVLRTLIYLCYALLKGHFFVKIPSQSA